MTFILGKYKSQARDYNNKITGVNEKLNTVLTELNKVDNVLGLDPNNANDALTYNVLISNSEIKKEVDSLVSDLGRYGLLISEKAEILDNEEMQKRALNEKRNTRNEEDGANNKIKAELK